MSYWWKVGKSESKINDASGQVFLFADTIDCCSKSFLHQKAVFTSTLDPGAITPLLAKPDSKCWVNIRINYKGFNNSKPYLDIYNGNLIQITMNYNLVSSNKCFWKFTLIVSGPIIIILSSECYWNSLFYVLGIRFWYSLIKTLKAIQLFCENFDI